MKPTVAGYCCLLLLPWISAFLVVEENSAPLYKRSDQAALLIKRQDSGNSGPSIPDSLDNKNDAFSKVPENDSKLDNSTKQEEVEEDKAPSKENSIKSEASPADNRSEPVADDEKKENGPKPEEPPSPSTPAPKKSEETTAASSVTDSTENKDSATDKKEDTVEASSVNPPSESSSSSNNNNNQDKTSENKNLTIAAPSDKKADSDTKKQEKKQDVPAKSDNENNATFSNITIKPSNNSQAKNNATYPVNLTSKVKAMSQGSANDSQTADKSPPIKANADPIKLIFSGVVILNGLILAFVGFRYPRLTMFYSGIITFGTIALIVMNAIHPYEPTNSKLTFIYLLMTLFAGIIGSCIFLAVGHRMTPAIGLMGGLILAAVIRAVLPQVKDYIHLALILGLPVLGLVATLCMKRVTVIFSTALAGATVASFGADLVIGTYFLFYGVYRKNKTGEYEAIPIAWAQWAVLVFVAFICMIFQLVKYRGEFYRDPKKRFRMSTHPITL